MEYKQFEVVVVLLLCLLLFAVVIPIGAHALLCLDKWFVQLHLNINIVMNSEE